MKNKLITALSIFVMALFIAALMSLHAVSADSYNWLCLRDGESVPISSLSDRYTCDLRSGAGFCRVCANSSLWYAAYTRCSGWECIYLNSPPQENFAATVNSPNSGIFNKRLQNIEIIANKISRIELFDGDNYRLLCPNCKEYNRPVVFSEGQHEIVIRATHGTSIIERAISFFIDSKKPLIRKTLPLQNSFTGSEFAVYYDELNVKEIKLYYGEAGKEKVKVLEGCPSGKAQSCLTSIDLNEYDGQQIIYWFEIKDIANNTAKSRIVKVYVDETSPVVNYLNWKISKNIILTNLSITEKNFKKVEYVDNNDNNARLKILCSSLSKNLCVKKISFKGASPDLLLRISDKAGNFVEREIKQ